MNIQMLSIGDRVEVRSIGFYKEMGDVVGFMKLRGVVVRALVAVPWKADERQVLMVSGEWVTWIDDGRCRS